MNIAFLGDSITEGYGASGYEKCFVKLVESKLQCQVFNYGVGGTCIARSKNCPSAVPCIVDWDFQQRVHNLPKAADKVFVFGGTNDYGWNSELGDFDSHDPYTFRGGLRNLIDSLLENYAKEKLCFILPLHRINEVRENKKFIDYIESMRSIVAEYGIDILDFYNDGLPAPLSEEDNRYFIDGLHPNDLGYEILADKICNYLRKKI